ncbi:MAG: 8-amino-7-oxononanoate synthase [Ideonella sp. MAG2]|nr:MAG: 8-amino-7-oxononanoate synthase [Ideonella sp. MAG2]
MFLEEAVTPVEGSTLPSDLDLALSGCTTDYLVKGSPDLLSKAKAFERWVATRLDLGLFPFARSLQAPPAAHTTLRELDGRELEGLNFSSQDYLSLSSHPSVLAAAQETMNRFGVHSAGSSALAGNVGEGVALEQALAEFLAMPHVLLFPTGWAAGFGVIRGLVRPDDHVVMDVLAHNCLQEGARAATRHVHLHRHLDVDHVRRLLARIRRQDPHNGIMLVTEGCFSMDADTPDLAALQTLAHQYKALLVVDVAHDLGSLGQGGQGQIGLQGMHGHIDVVVGAFSKTFASNGGFVAGRSRALKEYLRYYAPTATFSNALSPLQIAVVHQSLKIVRSVEGEWRREQLMQAVQALRQALTQHGLTVLGQPSPIVPVLLGEERWARLAVREMGQRQLLANLVEFPAVPRHSARLRMQVMSNHTPEQAQQAADILAAALETVRLKPQAGQTP